MRRAADRSSFGALLRQFRLGANLSQEALAERAAMSADGISALERGINTAPQRETLALLVGALQLDPQQRAAIETAAQRPSRPRRSRRSGASKHNLLRLVAPLVGRERDLADISALISDSRVLTLTGAGGVGKTRLAIQLGYQTLDEYEDGVCFVDLSTVRDTAGVTPGIANALGVRERADQPLIDAILTALARKKLLLILDNCEHVVSAAAEAVAAIAADCVDVRILATSRQPLGISGERTYRLASLSLEASVVLFSENAKRADASFSLNGDRGVVERICRRLDGIPLAIELAAARVQLLSLPQIEELLSERFAVLTGGRLARHQTMRALVDWSYDLLAPEERKLFARLAIFPAQFSFEAAVAICGGDGIASSRVLDILGSLVDKSLLTSERHGKTRRFRLLETMRAYGIEKLGDDISVLNRRHAEYYFKLVQSVDEGAPNWTDLLETDYDNLRRALDWAIDEQGDVALGVRLLSAMHEFLLSGGMSADSARRAERALDGSTPLTKPLQAMAWETIAAMRGDLLLAAKAHEASSRLLDLYEELGNHAGIGRALRGRGVANLRLGDFAQAERDLQRSLELSREHNDRRGVMRTLGSIAVAYEMTGRLEDGRTASLEVLAMARREGDERIAGITLMNLAETEFALGEIESATLRLEELLASKTTQKNIRLRANTKANLAAYLVGARRDSEALAMARAAIVDAREAGDAGIVACALQHLAALLSRSDPKTAAKLLGYVDGVFAQGYRREHTERYTYDLLMAALRDELSEGEIAALAHDGGALSELQAVHIATRAGSLPFILQPQRRARCAGSP
ncbi:MAG: helix-turn-helix domain-containing protein [Candidatus Eremiobacteraeota bacterium]|nr:helix-turn-helix domain-containing protein [Candidatus Eremiobacteraeota bacterium]